MSAEQDRVRELASRIARRVSEGEGRDNGGGSNSSRSAASSGDTRDELAAVRKSLDDLKRKLAALEENLSNEEEGAPFDSRAAHAPDERSAREPQRSNAQPPSSAHSPWLSGMYVPATHPSEERFGVEEAAVSELVDFFEKEKVCELEPGGKPCTHCAMCSARGF